MRSHSQYFDGAGTPYLSYPTHKKGKKWKNEKKNENKVGMICFSP